MLTIDVALAMNSAKLEIWSGKEEKFHTTVKSTKALRNSIVIMVSWKDTVLQVRSFGHFHFNTRKIVHIDAAPHLIGFQSQSNNAAAAATLKFWNFRGVMDHSMQEASKSRCFAGFSGPVCQLDTKGILQHCSSFSSCGSCMNSPRACRYVIIYKITINSWFQRSRCLTCYVSVLFLSAGAAHRIFVWHHIHRSMLCQPPYAPHLQA